MSSNLTNPEQNAIDICKFAYAHRAAYLLILREECLFQTIESNALKERFVEIKADKAYRNVYTQFEKKETVEFFIIKVAQVASIDPQYPPEYFRHGPNIKSGRIALFEDPIAYFLKFNLERLEKINGDISPYLQQYHIMQEIKAPTEEIYTYGGISYEIHSGKLTYGKHRVSLTPFSQGPELLKLLLIAEGGMVTYKQIAQHFNKYNEKYAHAQYGDLFKKMKQDLINQTKEQDVELAGILKGSIKAVSAGKGGYKLR